MKKENSLLNLQTQEQLLKIANHLEKSEIRDYYYYNPILLFKKYIPDFRWPQKIIEIFNDIYSGKVSRAIVKGPRGGGKSQLLSALAFSLWFLKRRKVIDIGGAFAQAKIVYNYLLGYINSDEVILDTLEKQPLMQHTLDKEGNYVKCIPASPKQVRGPHPDCLLGDEVCECKDELIEAAMPMVDTSENSLIILTSTFHKIFGIFQEYWDKADEKGYTRYSWDAFDVCKKFDKKIWNDPQLNKEIPDLKELKKLSEGKTGDVEGWIPVKNIIQAWREKPTLDYFLVEYMGSRPSQTGLVSKPEDVEGCIFDNTQTNKYNYVDGTFCTMGIDWGFSSMTSIVDLMLYKDGILSLIENKNYTQIPSDVIIEDIIEMCIDRPRKIIYADSAGKFENVALQQALTKAYNSGRMKMKTIVREVVFSKEKIGGLGTYRSYIEKRLLRIPEKFIVAIWQIKRYRYQPDSDKPLKKDDHIPDALICALIPFNREKIKSNYKEPDPDDIEKKDKPFTHGLLQERF